MEYFSFTSLFSFHKGYHFFTLPPAMSFVVPFPDFFCPIFSPAFHPSSFL